MRVLERFVSERILDPEPEQAKQFMTYLWRVGEQDRPRQLRFKGKVIEEFEGRCAFCKQRSYREIHHILPWREAIAVCDGDHEQLGRNLIPLCYRCHGETRDEEL